MRSTLPEWLLDTGILQFGYFVTGTNAVPFRFCPEYLPAYPNLLSEVARQTSLQFNDSEVDHLIATSDSVPLGLVCSLQTELPLVYSRGTRDAVVYNLVGSFNSGDMSALLINYIENASAIEKFISNARSVGLGIQIIVSLLEVWYVETLAEIPVRSVFRLVDIVEELATIGRLSEGQAQTVLTWICEQ